MKKLLKILSLSEEQINQLKQSFAAKTYQVRETLVYEGHCPVAGFVLLKGKISLSKKKKILADVPPGSALCVPELINNQPIRQNVDIHSGSTVLILDKTSSLEMRKRKVFREIFCGK